MISLSECTIDHSHKDVVNKLEDQRDFLTESLYNDIRNYLDSTLSQGKLNELFHLLKKYDLASSEEQNRRSDQLDQLVK